MAREIAVFVNQQGRCASVLTPGKVVIYRKEAGDWQPGRELEFMLDQGRGMRELRLQIAELIAFLGNCTIFVAQSVIGVAYFELEKAQVTIWEFEGAPAEFLDHILAEEEARVEAVLPAVAIPVCEETAPGCFAISIKEIQENELGITSKQILLPLIGKKNFASLTILCNHVPPWLETELAVRGYAAVAEKLAAHTYRVTVTVPAE